MSYHTKRQVVIVPAAKVDEFNAFMERNGYGPNMLVPGNDNKIGDAADAKEKAPSHYSIEIASADDGLIAACRKALAKCNDKLPAKEQGVESSGLKGKDPTKSKVNVDDVAADAGMKKKQIDKVVDVLVDDGKVK